MRSLASLGLGAALALTSTLTAPAANAQSGKNELRIGMLLTLSGGAAIIGKQMLNGWTLGMKHQGWTKNGDKLGGVPTRVFVEDDQRKPDVARRAVDKLLRSERVQMVTGVIWSNIAMAIYRPIARSKRVLLSLNATPSPLAGKQCSPYFLSLSWQGDNFSEALGKLMSQEGVKKVYLMAPNYQAGKDVLAGFERTFKGGKIVGRTLFKLGQRDYQADISKIRAANPDALMIFAPGAMGISFLKQWAASGVDKKVKLYSAFVVDNLTLPAIGKAAIGTYHTNYWDPSSDRPANQKFVKEYAAAHKRLPSHYAAQAYDGPALIAAALEKLGGKVPQRDMRPLAKAMRTVSFPSLRGPFKFNVNGVPIQDFIKREVIAGPDGKPTIVGRGVVLKNHKDSYWTQCPKARRLP